MERLKAENGARAASTQGARGWGERRGKEVAGAVGSDWARGRRGSRRHGYSSRMRPGAGRGGTPSQQDQGAPAQHVGRDGCGTRPRGEESSWGGKMGLEGAAGEMARQPFHPAMYRVISQKINQTKPTPHKQTKPLFIFFLFPFAPSLLFIAPTFWLQIFHCTMNLPAIGQSVSVVIYLFFSPFWDQNPN